MCGDGFQCRVSGALDGPLVVLFEQQCPDLLEHGRLVPEDADDVPATRDLAVETIPNTLRVIINVDHNAG